MNIVTLDNGLRIIINPVKWAKSVTNLILAWAWSRYENEKQRWISHFLEHMFFKWAIKYETPKAVSEAIDTFWGEFNAFTWKEYAWYYIKSASRNLEEWMDILSDMLLNSTFKKEEIDKERWVILEEMNMYLDMPKYQIAWEFENLIIWNQPLWYDQLWTNELINWVQTQDFKNYQKELYTPDNIIIILSWDIDEKTWTDLVKKYFWKMSWKRAFDFKKVEKNNSDKKIAILNKKTEQSHIIVWVKWTDWNDTENFWKQRVLSNLLWWMMSSRMFLNIREEKWLCYYIWTHTDDYTDFWIFSTSAWVTNEKVNLAVESILEEYSNISKEKVSEEELNKAKNNLIWRLLLSTEDSESLANMYWTQLLLKWKTTDIDEIIKKIEAVTSEDLLSHSKMIFKKENIYIAWIWPFWEDWRKNSEWSEIVEKSDL